MCECRLVRRLQGLPLYLSIRITAIIRDLFLNKERAVYLLQYGLIMAV